jgi:membrane-associated phospholipid phosphatase
MVTSANDRNFVAPPSLDDLHTVAHDSDGVDPAEPPIADTSAASARGPRTWMGRVRLALLIVYGVAYLAWFFEYGVIIDRISVGVSVAVFLVIGHIGKPWSAWRTLPFGLALYAAMWFAYDETRGAADRLGMPLQVESVRNIDRVLFLGADPVVWLQRNFLGAEVRFYDVIASVWYFSHFVVPVAAIAILWITNRQQWARFMRRFATVLAIACAMFVLLPTAPPWMAAGGDKRIRLDALPPLRRTSGNGWRHLGFDGFVHVWVDGRDWSNTTAAMPSLHAAFSLFVVVFFWPMISRRWLRLLTLVYPLVMGISLVYLGEHYVIDVLAGWAVVGLSFWMWARIERSWKRRRDTDAVLDAEPDPITTVATKEWA